MIWFVAWEPKMAWMTETLLLPCSFMKSHDKVLKLTSTDRWHARLQMHSMLSNQLRLYACACGVCAPAVSGRKQLCDRICTCSWHLTHDYYKWDTHLIAPNGFQMDSQIWDNSETSAFFNDDILLVFFFLVHNLKKVLAFMLDNYIWKLNILTLNWTF